MTVFAAERGPVPELLDSLVPVAEKRTAKPYCRSALAHASCLEATHKISDRKKERKIGYGHGHGHAYGET